MHESHSIDNVNVMSAPKKSWNADSGCEDNLDIQKNWEVNSRVKEYLMRKGLDIQ